MGIWIGDSKNTQAAHCALAISWAVSQVINPNLQAKWSDFTWTMRQGIGIDTGSAMLVRGGVRGDNDIISIGSAPNVAAKLSELRTYGINISDTVYGRLREDLKKNNSGESYWTYVGRKEFGGKTVGHYGSNWWWKP
jgi:class 3 adenylate cyclase